MGSGRTPRLDIEYPLGTDPAAFPSDIEGGAADFIDTYLAPWVQSSTEPVSPYNGMFWWNTTVGSATYGLNYYDGSTWHQVDTGKIYVGTTAPPILYPGLLWYNNTAASGSLSFYNGSIWVTIMPGTSTDGQVITSSAGGWIAASPGGGYTAGTGILISSGVIAINPAVVAQLASPAFTGTPTAPTAAPGTNTTQLATTQFVLANAPTSVVATVRELEVSTTSPTAILTYTPAVAGNVEIGIYFRVAVASTVVTVNVTWTDAAGSQTLPLLSAVTETVGSYTFTKFIVDSVGGEAIEVSATAGTANQLYFSASMVQN
jgi:hypothetical protein